MSALQFTPECVVGAVMGDRSAYNPDAETWFCADCANAAPALNRVAPLRFGMLDISSAGECRSTCENCGEAIV